LAGFGWFGLTGLAGLVWFGWFEFVSLCSVICQTLVQFGLKIQNK
jgi:hypothetical protein